MSEYWIGPVRLLDSLNNASTLFEPQLTFTGTPTALGLQPGQITGQTEWWQAHQLKELVNNPQRRVTIGGQSGVLEPIYFSDPMLGPLTSWCLLQSFQLGQADQTHSLQGTTGLVPYTLTLTQVGDATHRQVVVVRSARDKGNDFGITPQSLVVNPFWDEDPDGSPFITSPGGTRFTREYDAAFPHSTGGPPDPRRVSLYSAPFGAGADQLDTVVLPPLPPPSSPGEIPAWITSRALDARAYDRRQMHDVFGPEHRVSFTTDLMLVNGLCDFWVGNRGLRPFLHCQAFAGDDWREPGTVQFGTDADELDSARITRLTFDEVTVALSVRGRGDLFVTLRRGERQLRCTQPAGMPLPTWSGVPPASRARAARNATAHFGKGLAGGSDTEDTSWAAPFATWAGDDEHNWDGSPYAPDLRLRWPADVAPAKWASVWRYRPLRDRADLGTVGLRTLYSPGGIAEVEAYVDTDATVKVRVADTVVLTTPAVDFSADDDVLIGLHYDGSALTLSWKADDGTITHTSETVAIDAASFYDDTFFVNFSRWGDGSWGDGVWGGVTHYPGGAIDNDMVFEDGLSVNDFAGLASAASPLAGLPNPEARLRRYTPFDAQPLVSMPGLVDGLSVDPVTDDNGLTKMLAALSAGLDDVVASLVTTESGDTALDHHSQAAAQNEQQVRVR